MIFQNDSKFERPDLDPIFQTRQAIHGALERHPCLSKVRKIGSKSGRSNFESFLNWIYLVASTICTIRMYTILITGVRVISQ